MRLLSGYLGIWDNSESREAGKPCLKGFGEVGLSVPVILQLK